MVSAARVKLCPAHWTGVAAAHVLTNRKLRRAGSAENGALVPFAFRPDRGRMPRERCVAILAGIVNSAALHFDGNDVSRAAVVLATGLGIELNPADLWMPSLHLVWLTLSQFSWRVKYLPTNFVIPSLACKHLPHGRREAPAQAELGRATLKIADLDLRL